VAARPPVNTTQPSIVGTLREGERLTADPGAWRGTEPLHYAYRWRRCDPDGTACADVAGATQEGLVLTAADVDHAVRVVVRAWNAGGAQDAGSAPTARVQAAPGTGTPAPRPSTGQPPPDISATPAPPPATGAGGTPLADLAGLPGSLVTEGSCQQLVGGTGAYRAQLADVGAVIVRVRADAVVAPEAPVRVTVSAPGGRRVRARLTVDRRSVRVTGRNPLVGSIAPAALGGAGTHLLQVALTAPKGTTRTVTARLRSAACATRFTARGRTAAAGSALGLRIDSRAAISRVAFTVPAAMALRGGRAARAVGRLRFVVGGGRSRTLRLVIPADKRSGVLLAGKGGPRVTFSPRSLTVSALPPAAGIVELTVNEPGRTAMGRLRLRARVTGARGSTTLAVRTH
jgi:hypothetical protein